jgi:UDP-GlcNAc:undecaprenyl-phosphate GlcNAc-1-phosphate transferase
MSFPINIYLLAFVAGVISTALALPFCRKFCWRIGLVDDPGERKIHDKPMALAGGLAVFIGLIVSLVVGFAAIHFHVFGTASGAALSYGFSRRALQIVAIFVGGAGMLLLGAADDKWELKPATKLAGQLLVALLVAASGVRITMFVPSVAFSYFITVLWILTLINAFNFMDNMNGLCAGLGAIAGWYFGLVAASSGQYLVAVFAFLIAGTLLGFLPYNFPKASAFLGDAGSHLIGYLLAILAILPHFYTAQHPKMIALVTPLLVLAVPLLDLLSVVIFRLQTGKPIYIGDNNHLSHRLVRAGGTPTQAVIFIWCLAAAIGSAAIFFT